MRSDLDWTKAPEAPYRTPDYGRTSSWKERPIDVRAEALAQVGPQRRGQIVARRTDEWRQSRDASEEHRSRQAEASGSGDRAVPIPWEPAIRRRRKRDPAYPSSMIRYAGRAGQAYALAWRNYSWGLKERPSGWTEFRKVWEKKRSSP